jgi:CheY-like chemotaxis protein
LPTREATLTQAIQFLQNVGGVAFVLPVQLPGQDGLSLTRQLKAHPATAAIPIVALTAHAMPGDREQALAAGCVGYISKPIDTRTLGDQVREFPSAPRPESRVVGA